MQKDKTTLFILGGLGLATLFGAWAVWGYTAIEDLKDRIALQSKNLREIDRLQLDVYQMRQSAGPAPATGPPLTNIIGFLSSRASDRGVSGSKFKGINPVPPPAAQPNDPWIERGWRIDVADVRRSELLQFLLGVETEQPTFRTKEIQIHKFTPDGDIANATVQLSKYDPKEPPAKKP